MVVNHALFTVLRRFPSKTTAEAFTNFRAAKEAAELHSRKTNGRASVHVTGEKQTRCIYEAGELTLCRCNSER